MNTMMKTMISNTGVWEGRHPDRRRCMEMLQAYGTPEHVIRHCKAVAAVGYVLAQALNARGKRLDPDLILAAGLLHDMARVEDMHWEVAANYCEQRGLRQEAAIIRVHMTYDPFNDLEHLDETDVICLADRTVLEDHYTGIDRRIDYIIEKAERQGHPEHKPHILRKKNETKVLIGDIENFLGMSMDQLMDGIDYENVENSL